MPQPDDRPLYRFRGHVRPTASVRASVLAPKTSDGVAEILIYDPIDSYGDVWGVSAKEVVEGLATLGDDVTEIRLRINSPGGECSEAIAIVNAFRNHPARVTAVVDGLAASAASVLACSADDLVMGRNTQLMIHDAWAMAMGPAATMRDTAERLDKISDNLASIYAEKAGVEVSDMREAMLAETWYSAEEAVTAGLADRVEGIEREDNAADQDRFDLSIFAYAGRYEAPAPMLPAAPAARATPPAAPAPGDTTQEGADMAEISDEQLTTLRQMAGVADDADIDTALAAVEEALQEQADPPANTAAAAAASIGPEGSTIVVDAEVFAKMRADVEELASARQTQLEQSRAQAVEDAVRDGRISPAMRPAWAALLEKDPSAMDALAALTPGVPLEEVGHVGDTPTGSAANAKAVDDLYASIYTNQES